MSDRVYIVHSELVEDDAYTSTEIVGGVFYRDKEKAREKMVTVFINTTEALKDEKELKDFKVDINGDKMTFTADGRVSLVMKIVPLEEGV